MAPRDGAVEHGAQYVMTAIRTARLSASIFVEETGNIGAHRRAEPTIADAVLDRIVHNAYRIDLKGES